MIENERLRRASEAWLRTALDFLREQELPLRPHVEVVFEGSDWWQYQEAPPRPDFGGLVASHRDYLQELPELDEVIYAATEDESLGAVLLTDGGGQPLPVNARRRRILNQYLGRLAIRYLEASGEFAFQEAMFADLYNAFEQRVYRPDTICVKRLVHVENLDSETDEVSLAPGFVLRRVTDDERARAIKNPYRVSHFGEPMIPGVVLDVRELTLADRDSAHGRVQEAADATLLALRLVGSQPVGVNLIEHRIDNPFIDIPGGAQLPDSTVPPRSASRYVLTADMAVEVQGIWEKARQSLKHQQLSLAAARLGDAQAHSRPGDRLIDFWVALEALFIGSDSTQELKFRASMRIARFVGESPEMRWCLYEDLKESYNLRSGIVHGGLNAKSERRLLEVAERTGKVLRQALRKCVELTEEPDLEAIDQSLLS